MRERGDGKAEQMACDLIAETLATLKERVVALELDRTERLTLALYLMDMMTVAVTSHTDDELYVAPGL